MATLGTRQGSQPRPLHSQLLGGDGHLDMWHRSGGWPVGKGSLKSYLLTWPLPNCPSAPTLSSSPLSPPHWAWFPPLTREWDLVFLRAFLPRGQRLRASEVLGNASSREEASEAKPSRTQRGHGSSLTCRQDHLPRPPQPLLASSSGATILGSCSLLVPQRPWGQRQDREGLGWPHTACVPPPRSGDMHSCGLESCSPDVGLAVAGWSGLRAERTPTRPARQPVPHLQPPWSPLPSPSHVVLSNSSKCGHGRQGLLEGGTRHGEGTPRGTSSRSPPLL